MANAFSQIQLNQKEAGKALGFIVAVWKTAVTIFRPPVVIVVALFGLILEFLIELPFRILMLLEKMANPKRLS